MKVRSQKPRTVLITGAAGGLGQGLVAEFFDQGWNIVAACRPHRGGAPRVVSRARESARIAWVEMDVSCRDQIRKAVGQTVSRWGRIDALINNAGANADALLPRTTEEEWNRVTAVNLTGAFLCSQAVLPSMMKQRDGQIICVSSFSGRAGAAGQTAYASAKAGLFGMTMALAKEVGSRNVRVNAVLPGVLPTRMTADLSQARLREFAAANVLGRINSIDEVARFIVFLAGTRNISGQVFQLDSRIARWT